MKAKILILLQALLLVGAGGWVAAPALRGGWIWDDAAEVAQHPALRDPAGLRKIWFTPTETDYFPLKSSVQWVEWRIWGNNPAGYHAVSLGLHLLAALLFWRLLRRLVAGAWGDWGAWFGALLLVVHPLTVESVAWIAELKNTLSLPFLLLAMLAWVEYEGRAGRLGPPGKPLTSASYSIPQVFPAGPAGPPYLKAWLLFLAAMLSKTSAVMFPAVLLLYAWWRRGRIGRRDLIATAPFFAVSLGLGLVTLWFQQQHAIRGADLGSRSVLAHLAVAGISPWFYVAKFCWPDPLMPIYPRWEGFSMAGLLPGLAAAASIAWLGAKRAAWSRAALFGFGCFLLTAIPILGIFPMAFQRLSWVSDHFVYLPMLGLAGCVAGALEWRGLRGPLVFGLAALGLGVLAGLGHRQAMIFQSDERFWTEALARNPRAWLAHNDLGLIEAESGRTEQAIAHYRALIRLNPAFPEAHNNLGNALAVLGRQPEAVAEYDEALRLQPDYLDARGNRGSALGQGGQWAAAIADYQEVLRRRPNDRRVQGYLAEMHYRLANSLANADRLAAAVPRYREAVRLNPAYAEAYANLGLALAGLQQNGEAVAQLEQALRIRPDYPEAEAYLGLALGQSGRWAEAVAHYQRALRSHPDNPDLRYRLREALRAEGRSP